jgi:3-deoxy-manno-octulosonate cytidylyltransferase (CMP-KDO synthetase)
MTVTCVIPARMNSSRFPGKPLKKILGREMVLRVCDIAIESQLIDQVVVATEDVEIQQRVNDEGFSAILTPPFPSCTHRVALVAQQIKTDYIVNLQGDEPCVTPKMVDDIVDFTLKNNHRVVQATYDIEFDDMTNPDIVKVVINNGRVINLTRIPEVVCSNLVGMAGIYVYDHLSITNFPAMDLGLVEAWKGLDTFGFIGRVPVVPFKLPYRTHGVDRPSDIVLVEEKLYDEGHKIVYHTARGGGPYHNPEERFDGDTIQACYKRWYTYTEQQLLDWGCKYHELIMGKYSGDVYIDDKAINSDVFF